MKALEKDRDRRYESASAFAADLERYLHDEPVQAYPPTALYRLRKFAQRHKRVLVAGMLVLCSLAIVGWAVRDRYVWQRELSLRAQHDLALTEQGVRRAVEQATENSGELHAALTRPGGVQQLLNQPDRWGLLIETAQSETDTGASVGGSRRR